MARIDDAVSRILTKKFELGLFEHPYTDRTHLSEIGDAAHHAVARRAVAESQVLLKNERATLPIRGSTAGVRRRQQRRQHRQPGGWLDPHLAGRLDQRDPRPDDPRRASQSEHDNVTFSQDASAPVPSNAVGIVVVGETPYAEGYGDVAARSGPTTRATTTSRARRRPCSSPTPTRPR